MKIRSFAYLAILALLVSVMAGCGGGGGGGGAAPTMSLAATPTSMPADGITTSTITATFSSAVADGTVVNFAVVSGAATLSATSATTTGNKAFIKVTSNTVGNAIIRATSGGLSAQAGLTFNTPGIAQAFTVTASPTTLPADDTTTSTITATFTSPVPNGTVVDFKVAAGVAATLSAPSATTTTNQASITVKSSIAGVAIITATSGGFAANAAVAFNSPGVTVTALKNGTPNNVALANNADIVAIQATFPASVTTGTSVTYTATPVAIGGSSGANALFINNTNTIGVSTVGSVASTTITSGTIGGVIITATAGTLQGSVYVKFITQPTAVNVSVAVVPGGAVTTIPALGALQYDLTDAAGWDYVSNSAAALNSASGSKIAANQNTATSTTIGLINASGFTPTTLPIEQLTFSITSLGLPAFAVSNAPGTITAADVNGTAISPSLTAANFVVTLKFNTDTF